MTRVEKNLNKRLIGLILGKTLLDVTPRSQTPKGKGLFQRVLHFFADGMKELKKNL